MKAVRLHAFGEPLRHEEVPEPNPGEGEVLIEIAYAGVNPIDLWLTQGNVSGGIQVLPFVPGSDASGFVGDRPVVVHGRGMGVIRDGFYRERAAVPLDAVVELPTSVNLADAAAIGVPGSTAWMLVHDIASVSPEDRVLVLGCSGGVGNLVVQLTSNLGAAVLGQTSNPRKAPFIREHLGCDLLIAGPDELTEAAAFFEPTIVFDPLGNGFTDASVQIVAPGGSIVVFGTSAGPTGQIDLRALYKSGITIVGYSASSKTVQTVRSALESVILELAGDRLRPAIDSVLPLREAQEAHRKLRTQEVKGKLLLTP